MARTIRGMAPRLTRDVRLTMLRQRDLIADWQAADAGIAPRSLRRACHQGWKLHGFHVFSDRDTDLTPAQRRMVAVLEFGPQALLTGRAALVEHGWSLDDGDHVDLLVDRSTRGRRHPDLPWLRRHTTLAMLPSRAGLPARVGVAHAAIDAAAGARTAREALLVIVSVAQQRLASPQRLSREALRRPKLRHRRWIDEALRELLQGATSTTEADFLRECRRRGLPQPRMQTRRVDARSGRRRTDAEFRTADGRLVIVEIDGVGHMEVAQWHADLARHNDLAVTTGALALRVSGWEVRNDPDPFFTLLRAVVLG